MRCQFLKRPERTDVVAVVGMPTEKRIKEGHDEHDKESDRGHGIARTGGGKIDHVGEIDESSGPEAKYSGVEYLLNCAHMPVFRYQWYDSAGQYHRHHDDGSRKRRAGGLFMPDCHCRSFSIHSQVDAFMHILDHGI